MDPRRIKKIAFILFSAAVLVVVLISVVVYYHPVMNFDVYLSHRLQGSDDIYQNVFLQNILIATSWLGQTTVAAAILLLFSLIFWLYKYYWENLFCLLSGLSALINALLKIFIHRPRPSESIVHIIDHQFSPSYPSGHVVFFTVFYGFLVTAMFFTPRIPKLLRIFIGIVSILLIILISFSRIYLGSHWATDVIGGYALGLALLSILLYFYLRNYTKK